jgi:subtilisin family serine protease
MGPNEPKNKEEAELLRRSKVSAHLRAMVADWERRGRTEIPAGTKVDKPGDVPVIRVVIELKTPDTTELTQAGIDITHYFGFFFVAEIPLDRLDSLADLESIQRVHYERPTLPGLDDSIPEIRCNSVRNSQFPFSGTNKYTGNGVIVGIIDSGINILHPVFRLPNDQTKTRILAILDQTQSPPVTFSKAQIEAAIASNTQIILPGAGAPRVETPSNDHKHGTHVAGIAAGNGKIAGNCDGEFTFVGVAPEATLVVVKYDFTGDVSLQAAIQFIADTAAPAPTPANPTPPRLPAVINMSIWDPLGPHDGTTRMDQMIDNWLAARPAGSPPVVLVTIAGNAGGHAVPGATTIAQHDDCHATGPIPPGSVVKRLGFNIRAWDPNQTGTGQIRASAEIRFTAPNGLGCRLIPPGNNTSGGSNLAAADGSTTFTEATQNSSCSISGELLDAVTGRRRITITIISAAGGQNQGGDWTIELTNAGAAAVTYHAWITGQQFERFTDDLSRANTIGSPGTAASMITVGSYHSSGKDKGKIADSSSRGPLLNSTSSQKPDLSAPGVNICSARRDFHDGCCCDCCCDSYKDESGTSMAAPHVAGAVALMLERNPALTHAQIKTVLMNRARKDGFTGTTNNNDFGNGKLDVIDLLNHPLVASGQPNVGSAASPRSAPQNRTAVEAVAAIPRFPQLEEGTPLWRLLQTEEGQRIFELGRSHWEEARALVNTHKRIAVVWRRNHGPLLIHHITRTAMLPNIPLPRELEGQELSVRAARIVSALEKRSSRELRMALHMTLPWVARLQGKTLLEVAEMLEAKELQYA